MVQLQQSLRSLVLLLRMRSAIAATARLCLAASAQQDSAQLGAAPLFVFPGGKGSFVSYWLVGPVATAVVAFDSCVMRM